MPTEVVETRLPGARGRLRAGERKRLVIADALSPEGVQILAGADGLEVDDRSGRSREEVRDALAGAAALIVRSATQVDEDLLARADTLEVIGRAGVGVDNIDVEAATRRGIAVLNAPGGNTVSTAELTFGLMLAVARRIVEADRAVRAGSWPRTELHGSQLRGKVLGVIGAGRIGSEVVRRGRAFGMHVLVTDPYLTTERARDLSAESVELEELLARADFVSIHAPLTESSRGMVGEAEFRLMKPEAVLVNAARGGIVDEDALAAALREGQLGGAALDVFEVEPLPADHPLRSAPRLVITPHLGAATAEAQREVAMEIAAAVRDALLAGDLRAAVNAPRVDPDLRAEFEPLLELARRLGVLAYELTGGRCERVDLRYAGPFEDVLRALAAGAMEGYLRRTVDRPLNLVNSLVLAAERGIRVGRVRTGDSAAYLHYVELSVRDGNDLVAGGAFLGEGHARLVRIGRYRISTVPSGTLVILRNRDVPGVIGEVGTRLGAAGINIAEYHQSRQEVGGEALAMITVDDPLGPGLLAELRSLPSVSEVRQVSFD
ncbi:MAG: phosphoglycerate dehydrogenase [Gemmatimonadota bacterium]